MLRRPPRATRTDTPYPSPTCFLSPAAVSDGSLFRFDRIRRIEILAVIGVLIGSVAVDTLLVVFETEVGLPEPVGIAFSDVARSEEHTSELQSLMRISYAVFCLKKKQ